MIVYLITVTSALCTGEPHHHMERTIMSAMKSNPKTGGKKHSKPRKDRDNVVTLSTLRREQYVLVATEQFTAEQIREFDFRIMTLKRQRGWTDKTHGLLVIKLVRDMIKGELSANSSELCSQTRSILNDAFEDYCKDRGIPFAKLPIPQLADAS